MDSCQNGSSRSPDDAACTVAESDEQEFDFLKIDKPRPVVEKPLEKCNSCFALFKDSENSSHSVENMDDAGSLLPKSDMNGTGSLESEAWEALRRSLVYFRGQPVGTIAALDSSGENANYDQVPKCFHLNPSSSSLLVLSCYFNGFDHCVLHHFCTF